MKGEVMGGVNERWDGRGLSHGRGVGDKGWNVTPVRTVPFQVTFISCCIWE